MLHDASIKIADKINIYFITCCFIIIQSNIDAIPITIKETIKCPILVKIPHTIRKPTALQKLFGSVHSHAKNPLPTNTAAVAEYNNPAMIHPLLESLMFC